MFIEVDELPEGATEASVISKDEHEKVLSELQEKFDEIESQLAESISQLDEYKTLNSELSQKYAKAVLDAKPSTSEPKSDTEKPSIPVSVKALFSKE